jgi:ankyrin repeat protein
MDISYGENALMLSVRANNISAVIKHINRGINIEHKNTKGKTALYIASDFGYCDIVLVLLNWGANSYSENNIGWTAIDIAAFRGHRKIVDIINKHNFEMQKELAESYHSAI